MTNTKFPGGDDVEVEILKDKALAFLNMLLDTETGRLATRVGRNGKDKRVLKAVAKRKARAAFLQAAITKIRQQLRVLGGGYK